MTDTLTELVAGSDSPDVPDGTATGKPDVEELQKWLNKANKEAAERKQANKQLQSELDALKAEQTAATEKALAEQGQYQTLFEAEKKRAEAEAARAAELEGRIKAQEVSMLRQRIAVEKGLPVALAARLRGETEDEISTDADELLKAIPVPQPANGQRTATPPTPAAQGTRGLTPEELRSKAPRTF